MKTKPFIEIDLEKVEELASHGLTMEQIATSLGLSESTLYRRKRTVTEMTEAIKRGRQKGVATIANKLYASAEGGNLAAMIFFLKTQGGWKETSKQAISGELDVNAKVKTDGILGWYELAEKKCP